MGTTDDEEDKYLDELMSETFAIESQKLEPNFDKLFKLIGPAPITVPKVLNLKASEFMSAPISHFIKLCEDHSYSKVISGLTYIRNVSSNGDQAVIERVKVLQEDLKRWRTTSSQLDQNKQDVQPAQLASSEIKPTDQGMTSEVPQ